MNKNIKNYDIKGTSEFIYNMRNAVKDAWHDKIIGDVSVKYYLDWVVFNNEYEGVTSLYSAISDGLNRQLELTNNETTNPYTDFVENKRTFTVQSLKQMFMFFSQVTDDSDYSIVMAVLEKQLKIKFILFTMFPHNLPMTVGDIVLYKNIPYRIVADNNDTNTYDLYNGYNTTKTVSKSKTELFKNNPLNNFRIACNSNDNNDPMIFQDFMYIVLIKNTDEYNNETIKFKLVHDTNKEYIISENDISIYIQYLLYNSCPILDAQKLNLMGYRNTNMQKTILGFEENRIPKENSQQSINKDINKAEKKLLEYETNYKLLKKTMPSTLDNAQEAEKFLYKEEIKELKQTIHNLKALQKQQNSDKQHGGATQPSTQYNNYMLPTNTNYNYNNNNNNPYPYPQYMPPYMYKYPYMYNNPYIKQPVAIQNKEKDNQSKLAFYITIELELFPGKTPNMLQKSIIKCQSTFERIREAWTDIFGFKYVPGPMNEYYLYAQQAQQASKEPETKNNNK
jgi:hypothetical protein